MAELDGTLRSLSPKQRDLLLRRLQQEGRPQAKGIPRLVRGEGEITFPLSFAQERLWFLDRMEAGSALYNIPAVIETFGRFDPEVLARILREIVCRHEALRTTFRIATADPEQVVHAEMRTPLEVVDLRSLPAERRRGEADGQAAAEIRRPFDLEHGPLLRVLVLILDDEHHLLVLTLHHIVSDGWSMGVLVREIGALYPALHRGLGPRPAGAPELPQLPALPIQYGDFAVWQREWLSGFELERQVSFWRQRLAGAPAVLNLPCDRRRPPLVSSAGRQTPLALSPELVAALRALAREQGSTLFMVLFSAYALLLHRLSGQESLLVGSPVANRGRREIEGLIGFFVNTIVLRSDLPDDPTFGELLARSREMSLAAHAHQDLPFERLVELLGVERDLSRAPLVQAAFSLQRAEAERLVLPGLELVPREADTRTAKFELMAFLTEGTETVSGWLESSSALFDAATIVRFGERFATLLAALPGRAAARVSELPFLLAAERQALLCEWSRPAFDPPATVTLLHGFLRAAVARTPQGLAVVAEDESLTYAELDRRANRLAHWLRGRGVGPEVLVGLCLQKSARRTVALLAVLKAGGAYLPLDPAYPREQLRLMLEDSGALLVLSESSLAEIVTQERARVWLLDRESELGAAFGTAPATAPEELASPANLAYVIFTSGSTGRPKGVAVPHAGVCGVVLETARIVGMESDTRIPQLSRLNFDVSVLEHFCTFHAGGTLHLMPAGLLGQELTRELRRRGITHLVPGPPALIESMVEEVPTLRALAVAGEPCPPEVAARWSARCAMFNGYGPTEISIICTLHRFPPGLRATPPMGYPFAGARLHVLDRQMRPVAAGCEGELFIGGPGVTRGYLRRPALTAERFLPDPFGAAPGARLYRTGDLVRLQPDGAIDFVARIDNQVKLRGFRIELGEVESAINRHPGVERSLALVREDAPGDRRLVAYVVPQQPAGAALSPAEVRRFLREQLPDFMIPSAVLLLPALPLSPAGKVDRRSLPAPGAPVREEGEARLPRNEIERAIADLWREVLHLDAGQRLGVDDNFFDLGGHSVLMARVQGRLQAELGREVSLVELFRYPTIAAIAAFLSPEGEVVPAHFVGYERARQRRTAGGSGAVAMVGMACRFPGAPDVETFWRNLASGVESIRNFSADELRAAGVPEGELRDPAYVRARGVVDDADRFDAGFFGYSPREAEIIDPQQRLFLQCAWETFEDAGLDPARMTGDVAVYAGVGMNTYAFGLLPDPEVRDSVGSFQISIGNDKDFLATRVSYKLGLKGPSLTVQTACSTALVAVHLACQSLRNGECDAALAGGVALRLPQESGYQHHAGAVFSSDGHCRAFDAEGSGFVPGNGVGAVLLKRLEDALRDGDPIRAVIRGSAVNNDGALKAGYTAPSVEGQAAVITQALAVGEVPAESVGYVEAHGTGTDLGDPIEIAALKLAFGPEPGPGSCAVGSVKTNIGHLDSAAGVAGLIKAALVLERGWIPPTLHFKSPNPKLELAGSPFRIADRLAPWPRGLAVRRAGVSSMGIGGTNAHVVLEEAPAAPPLPATSSWQLLPLSARTEDALGTAMERLAVHLEARPEISLGDVALTLQTGRRRFERRAVVLARSPEEAAAALRSAEPERLIRSGDGAAEARSVVFLCSGQGSQYPNMGRELYAAGGVYRQWLDAACDGLLPHLGVDLRALLFPLPGGEAEAGPRLAATEITQPALFAVEHALARQWMAWGIRPAALIGHSIGEYVAACLAGVFSFADALRLVAERGRAMAAMAPGAMLAVGLSESELVPLLPADLDLAAVNAPRRTVVAGTEAAVAAFAAVLAERGVASRRLHTSHAYHSRWMEEAMPRLRAALAAIELHPPEVPIRSNVTGGWLRAEEATDPEYWVLHLRGAVRFAAGVAELLREPERIFLEVGPGNALMSLVRESEPRAATVASLPHPSDRRDARAFVLAALGRLWIAGLSPDWQAVRGGEPARRIPLPAYPFERRRFWIEGAGLLGGGVGTGGARALAKRPRVADWFYAPTWRREALPAAPERVAGVDGEGPPLVLLFVEPLGTSSPLGDALRSAGHQVIEVGSAERFERRGPSAFVLRPREREDHDRLLAELEEERRRPTLLLHAWGLEPAPDLDSALDRGFTSLLHLAQAAGRIDADPRPRLVAVASGLFDVLGAEEVVPAKATLLGALRTIPWELPALGCLLVEVEGPPAGSPLARDLAARIAERALLPAPPAAGRLEVAALRGPHVWLPAWEEVRLDQPGAAAVAGSGVREGGVYLVTGGFGGLGLEAAAALAEGHRVKLALLGRRELPPRESWRAASLDPVLPGEQRAVLLRLLALEEAGAEILPLAADVGDPDALRGVLAKIDRRFGDLHGVIHAAGVSGGELIQRKTRGATEEMLHPRVRGLEALLAALGDRRLDFLLLTSALGGLFGEPGQADLCAACAYFDAFATSRRRSGTHVVAIDWDTWREVGMAARLDGLPAELRAARQEALATAIEPAEGRAALALILAAGSLPQVAVSTRDLPALERRLAAFLRDGGTAGSGTRGGHARPQLGNAYVAPRDTTEETVARIWQELLGIERVGVEDNFFDLGGHSLLATQVASRVREALGTELPIEELFAAPTVAGIAAYAARRPTKEGEEMSLEALLQQIESLSPEEAQALLREEGE